MARRPSTFVVLDVQFRQRNEQPFPDALEVLSIATGHGLLELIQYLFESFSLVSVHLADDPLAEEHESLVAQFIAGIEFQLPQVAEGHLQGLVRQILRVLRQNGLKLLSRRGNVSFNIQDPVEVVCESDMHGRSPRAGR